MTMKIRLKMKNGSHRNDLNIPRPRYKMCLVHFLVNKEIQKHLASFALKNMSSENINEIPEELLYRSDFFFAKLQVKTLPVTENAFFICIY